jgi:hypothetical protein
VSASSLAPPANDAETVATCFFASGQLQCFAGVVLFLPLREPVMLGQSWKDVIAHIPPEARDGLGLVTASSVEINIQTVMRLEDEYMVIRGRLTGSLDAGRTFFVPYDQINCLIFQRFLKEQEVQAWFGAPAAPAEATATADGAPGEAAAAEAEAAGQALSTAAASPSGPLPGKAAILERLRKRTGSAPGTVKKPALGSAPGTTPKPTLSSTPGTVVKPPLGQKPGANPGNTPPKPPEK